MSPLKSETDKFSISGYQQPQGYLFIQREEFGKAQCFFKDLGNYNNLVVRLFGKIRS